MDKSFITKVVFLILILISLGFPQDYIKELPPQRNQLFCLLRVKIETIREENLKTTDSSKIRESTTKNYYDPKGYLIKKEVYDSSSTTPSVVREYKYDEKGNYSEFFINGKLRERREYNESGKITHIYYYNFGELSKTLLFKYDSFGNEKEIFTKYSSGRTDTNLIFYYNYDYTVTPPRIISDTTFSREQYDRGITISEYDSIGRCKRSITRYPESKWNYTTLFFYNDKNLFDSTIQYSSSGISKYIRQYDKNYRLTRTLDYNKADSSPYICNYVYDNKIFMTIDSLFQKNDYELTKISDFEKIGVTLETVPKGENEIRVKLMTQYYSNGLVKNTIRYDCDNNNIEKKFYNYDFY